MKEEEDDDDDDDDEEKKLATQSEKYLCIFSSFVLTFLLAKERERERKTFFV